MDAGLPVTSGDRVPTVEEWLRFWLDNIAVARVRPSTLQAYRGYAINRIIPALGKHRLDRLQPEHLETFYRASTAAGLAPATVLQMHRILSRALKVALQRGRVARNVATLVDAPSVVPSGDRPADARGGAKDPRRCGRHPPCRPLVGRTGPRTTPRRGARSALERCRS